MELWQAEWCPGSRRVRQRLTELGVDYVARQVPVDRAERAALVAATGADSVPALVVDDGTALVDEAAILGWLDAHVPEPPGAAAHRERAERVRRREAAEAVAAAAAGSDRA